MNNKMTELMDLRMHQHIAHEIYRQQMLQRIPDPYPSMMPMHAMALPPRYSLPDVEVKLQNKDLWKQFHKIGTEMIITKCGRRMFPSTRLSVSGLDVDTNYCVLLEMMPVSDCRYKFNGNQWVPAGGAEPQSPQRMFLHPDSPALGSHWSSQPILFNKVKLTNNTLDNNGHIVLTSMHKYQPRIHIIRTSDPSQIPWAAQQAFTFAETEFVAVTAYQNDRITKLKIDNNPFAKGFRETGQSRCKRKIVSSSPHSASESKSDEDDSNAQDVKRTKSNGSACSESEHMSQTSSPAHEFLRHQENDRLNHEILMHQYNQSMHHMLNPGWMDLVFPYLNRNPYHQQHLQNHQPHHQNMMTPLNESPNESIHESEVSSPRRSPTPTPTPSTSSGSEVKKENCEESESKLPEDKEKDKDKDKKTNFSIAAILLL